MWAPAEQRLVVFRGGFTALTSGDARRQTSPKPDATRPMTMTDQKMRAGQYDRVVMTYPF